MDKSFTVKTAAGERKQTWHYPSRAECMVCHSRAANFVLGLSTLQMNMNYDYTGCSDNQLRVFEHLGILKGFDWADQAREELADRAAAKKLTGKAAEEYAKVHGQQPNQREAKAFSLLPATPGNLPHLVDPLDSKQDLTKRAKSWLHTNCSMCHVEAGGGNAKMELEYNTPLDKMRLLDVKPIHTTLGIPEAKLIAPGSPEKSVLLKGCSCAAATRCRPSQPIASTKPAWQCCVSG